MRSTLNYLCLLLMLCSAPWLSWAAPAADHPNANPPISLSANSLTYYAQPGDTLISISRQFTGRSDNWIQLGKLNRIAKDISIPIGTPIVIPAELLTDETVDAKVIAYSGPVAVIDDNGHAVQVAVGTTLAEGMQVETGNNGFISLSLPGGSRITLPSNTRVKLTKLRVSLYFKSPRTEITLMRGRVESRVNPLDQNKGRFEVRTPLSVAGVRGTHFRVRYSENQVATEVLEGTVAVSKIDHRSSAMVSAEKGNITNAATVGSVVNLLPAPRIIAPAGGYANYSVARFTLAPLAGAAAYHVQISTDREGQNIISESRSLERDIALNSMPDGAYFMHASAIDRQGLEGLPQTQEFTLRSRDIPASPSVESSDLRTVTLSWRAQPHQKYQLQVARDTTFTWLIHSQVTDAGQAQLPRPPFGTYYARVQALNADGSAGTFSATQAFTVTDQWVVNEGFTAAKDGRATQKR